MQQLPSLVSVLPFNNSIRVVDLGLLREHWLAKGECVLSSSHLLSALASPIHSTSTFPLESSFPPWGWLPQRPRMVATPPCWPGAFPLPLSVLVQEAPGPTWSTSGHTPSMSGTTGVSLVLKSRLNTLCCLCGPWGPLLSYPS